MTNPNSFSPGSANQIANAIQAQGLQNQFSQSIFNAWQAGSASYAQTAAEIAAGITPVNFGYLSSPLDLRRYGADATGATFSDAAMTSAIAVCGSGALNGGRIYLPAGKYKFANPWVLTSGITIEGDGCTTGGTFPGTQIIYTGTSSAHFIQMTGLGGCALKRMQITNTGAFTGAMLGAHGSSNCTTEDVVFNATTFGCYHIELDQSLQFTANRCSFYAGAFSVNGQSSAGGSFSNQIRFDNCFWQGQAAPPINYGGQAWTFKSCTFENLSNGKAGCFGNTTSTQCFGLTFAGCWFGDVSVAGGVWLSLTFCSGVVISGNFFSGEVTSTVAVALNGCGSAMITGNLFTSFLTGINLVTNITKGLVIKGNQFSAVTTSLGGSVSFGDATTSEIGPNDPQIGFAPYVAAGINGHEWSANGVLRQWGEVTVTAGTSLPVTFSPAFPTTLFNLQVSIRSGATTNTAAATAATTSGFNLNCAGAGSVLVDWSATGN
jgi:Pectate lyase superfamily protein